MKNICSMTYTLRPLIAQTTSRASVRKVRLLTAVWLVSSTFGIGGIGISAAFGATPAESNPNTVILDHFDGTTQGTPFGDPAYVTSLTGLNKAVNLTAGTYIQYQLPASLQQAGTIEAWVNLKSYGASIINFNWYNTTSYPPAGHVLHFQVGTDGKLTTGGWAYNPQDMYGLTSSSAVPLGQWSHVAFSWSQYGSKLYINGALTASSTQPYQPAGPRYAYLNYWGGSSLGYVDELQISDVQRTDAEIQADAAGASSALAFYPVIPCRVVDTRNAIGPLGGPSIGKQSSRDFPVQSSSCGIPATAAAYTLNVTAIPHGPLGYLTIWPTGASQPIVSTLNSLLGTVVANAAIVQAGSSGQVSVYVSDAADVILDINGYFAP